MKATNIIKTMSIVALTLFLSTTMLAQEKPAKATKSMQKHVCTDECKTDGCAAVKAKGTKTTMAKHKCTDECHTIGCAAVDAKAAKANSAKHVCTDECKTAGCDVVKTKDDLIYAADAKVVVDNNSLYRHKDIAEMRDFDEEDATEVEAGKYDLNYVKLDGNVGCMVNGAGLAMATMDIIKMSGGDPANFLDVGGTASAERVEQAFRIILKDPHVKAILVNIFGGIVRCDRVANGVVQAYKNLGEIDIPIIVRLQGTNAEEGKEIIDQSGLKVFSAVTLDDAAQLVTEQVK